jgi:non-canonical purine NTP pyrophosphatase (RdgB/HAM1 family)
VEDTSLTFEALGKIPGPFIKWFLKEIGNIGLCRMLNSFDSRKAIFTTMFAYYDGKELKIFRKSTSGSIANVPRGNNGFGWDALFIPKGSTKTRGEMTHAEQDFYTARKLLIPELKVFFHNNF